MEGSTLFLTRAAEEKWRSIFGNCFPKRNALGGWETLNYEIKEGEPFVILGKGIARYRNGIRPRSSHSAARLLRRCCLFSYVCSHRPHRKGLACLRDWMIIVGSELMPVLSGEVREGSHGLSGDFC